MNIKVVLGGSLRQESVHNGFTSLRSGIDLVVIHDVARPLFGISDLKKCIDEAYISGAAVLAIPVTDTIKKGIHDKSDKDKYYAECTINRDKLFLVQTPQVFRYNLLSDAYKKSSLSSTKITVTDEAQMVEILGNPVSLVIGERSNIKITYPEDLKIAKGILSDNKDKQELRI